MADELPPTVPIADGEAHVGATLGRFTPLGVLGRGGMGVVLRAKDPELDREVAIKVLAASSTGTSSAAAVRLQREAQAMAKLSHPNVVTVYEMGQVGDSRFIAMELVEGATLRTWLETPRPWREIVDQFVACGRGLAAAHAAGVIHRDFKPENVLIGADGRPRVVDFGLAGVEAAIAGTPAYMAPEQWLGADCDARTDVFAFCVALWEALYGVRPFGDADEGLQARVLAGEPGELRDARGVDGAIEAHLRRGLARDREARWPAMEPLLAVLAARPRRWWPWLAGGAVAAVAITSVAMLATSSAPPEPCPEPQLAGVWDPTVEARVRAAFRAAAPALADDTAQRVVAGLDGYAKQWREASVGACKATRVDGTQSPELLDRRTQCLARRAHELGALTSALGAVSTRDQVERAVDAVGALGALAECANGELLLAFAPPSDPALRARVDQLDRAIETSHQASLIGGKPAERQTHAAEMVEQARGLGFPPVIVRALNEASEAASDNGDREAQERYLRELAQRSAEVHDDGRAARAWIDLIRLLAETRRLDEAKALEPAAEAAVARAGRLRQLVYVQLATLGVRKLYAQDLPGAIAAFRQALDQADTDASKAGIQTALAQVLSLQEGPRSAIPMAEAAVASNERAYGKSHPRTATAMFVFAQALRDARDLTRAAELTAQVIALREAVFGPNHRELALAYQLAGMLDRQRGKLPAARASLERATAIFERDGRALDAGASRGALAAVVWDLEGPEAARPIYARALEQLAAGGRDQVAYVGVEVDYAYRLIEAKRCDQAAPLLAHAIDELPDKRVRQLPQVLEAAAHCDNLANQPTAALAKLVRARAMCQQFECPPQVGPMIAFKLGRLLIERGADRGRGRALIDEARDEATKQGQDDLLADIAHWQKLHPE